MRLTLGGRPSERHDELRPAQCMGCGRFERLNPALPLAALPRCRCGSPLNWRVDLGKGEPPQLICETFPQPFAQRDRLRPEAAKPGRGVRLAEAMAILTFRGKREG